LTIFWVVFDSEMNKLFGSGFGFEYLKHIFPLHFESKLGIRPKNPSKFRQNSAFGGISDFFLKIRPLYVGTLPLWIFFICFLKSCFLLFIFHIMFKLNWIIWIIFELSNLFWWFEYIRIFFKISNNSRIRIRTFFDLRIIFGFVKKKRFVHICFEAFIIISPEFFIIVQKKRTPFYIFEIHKFFVPLGK